MSTTRWHVPDDELRRYANGASDPPWLWSTDAHLSSCAACRQRLARAVDPDGAETGWSRLEGELDAPKPGLLEAAMVRLGVPEHTARLLFAVPALRLSWLAAVVLTLTSTTAAGHAAKALAVPILFLAVAPLLPLAGVALSFGPGVDPTYELALVAPMHTFRLLLLRCAVVLTTTTALTGAASLALPGYGPVALGWLLPALTMTLLSLALTPRLGPVAAAGWVGVGWLALLVGTVRFDTGESALFAATGQVALAVGAAAAAAALVKVRRAFDTGRPLSNPFLVATRRMTP
jgi:hypothetical protein